MKTLYLNHHCHAVRLENPLRIYHAKESLGQAALIRICPSVEECGPISAGGKLALGSIKTLWLKREEE